MAGVVWGREAEEDLRRIAYFIGIERRSPQAARTLIDAVRRKCELYASHPEMGQQRPDLAPGIRIFHVGSYVVLYFPTEDGIHVIRVFEGHRDYPALFMPADS